jgi:hypothetical protein
LTPVIVLSIQLDSIASDGLPVHGVFHRLASYLPGNIKFVDLPFNFASAAGLLDYETRMKELIAALCSGALKKQATPTPLHLSFVDLIPQVLMLCGLSGWPFGSQQRGSALCSKQ